MFLFTTLDSNVCYSEDVRLILRYSQGCLIHLHHSVPQGRIPPTLNSTIPFMWTCLIRPLDLPIMWQVARPTLDSTASSLHVDPEEVLEEGLLEVVVNAGVVHNQQQLIHSQDRLTHRLNESILPLQPKQQSVFISYE